MLFEILNIDSLSLIELIWHLLIKSVEIECKIFSEGNYRNWSDCVELIGGEI